MKHRTGRLDIDVTGNRVTLAGRFDDEGRAYELLTLIPAGDVVVDTSGLTFINSVGMREWMRLLRALRERGSVTLDRIADVLITQLNLLPDIARSVTITSFHAQYLCGNCGAESTPLVDAIAHAEGLARLQAPKLPCDECGAPMDLADFSERYLSLFRP